MGLFSKKKKKEDISLPELPKLPELPDFPTEGDEDRLPQLPSFPSNQVGEKFSQSAIKEAVTGRREVDEVDADESIGTRMMQEPPIPYTKDIDEGIPKKFREAAKLVKKAEPVFIRIDKFEQSLEVFEKAKKKIMEIEKMLKDIKKLKEKEDGELSDWETEIQTTKEQIERVDKELFSKIE